MMPATSDNELHGFASDECDLQELEAAARMDVIIGVIGCAGLIMFLGYLIYL